MITTAVQVGLMDPRHVMIRFSSKEDFIKAWTKETWVINGHYFRFFRWTPWFNPATESALAPVWISLPHLPLNFFNESCLRSIAGAIGKVLKIDGPTKILSRPSVARGCAENDLEKPRPEKIWIGMGKCGKLGRWQQIIYEKVPGFCSFCRKQGHDLSNCRLKAKKVEKISTKQWVQKTFTSKINSTNKRKKVQSSFCKKIKTKIWVQRRRRMLLDWRS